MAKDTPNFGSILDTQSSAVERPKPLPVGTYTCVIQGLPRFDKSSKKQTEFAEFKLKVLAAGEDVDTDDLTAMLGEKTLGDIPLKDTYYLTEDAIWRLKKFLDDCGIEEDDLTLRQRIEQTPGCQIAVTIKHEASQDGEAIFARVNGTAAVE